MRISLSAEAKRARLAVENDGPAIPEATLARLFDSMVSLRDPERGATPGEGAHLGLGLYIVRLITAFHGGTARSLNLGPERGVRFEIEVLLP